MKLVLSTLISESFCAGALGDLNNFRDVELVGANQAMIVTRVVNIWDSCSSLVFVYMIIPIEFASHFAHNFPHYNNRSLKTCLTGYLV